MAFRQNNRSGNRGGDRNSSRGSFGGRREGGFSRGGFGGRDRGENRRPEMHDVTCDKCGKECQVPFRPTGDKPVLCSDCFRKSGDPRGEGKSSSGGMSQEQFKQINAKLDKIIEFLDQIEFEEEEDLEGEEEEDEEESEAEEKA